MINNFSGKLNLGQGIFSLRQLEKSIQEQEKNEVISLEEADNSPKIPKKVIPEGMAAEINAMLNRLNVKNNPIEEIDNSSAIPKTVLPEGFAEEIKAILNGKNVKQPTSENNPTEEDENIPENVVQPTSEEESADVDKTDVNSAEALPSNKINIDRAGLLLMVSQFTLAQLKALGLKQEDIDKYFVDATIRPVGTEGEPEYYRLRTREINGRTVNTIEEAVEAIIDAKIEEITNRLYTAYRNGDLNFSDMKSALEEAGAENVKYLPASYGRVKVVFTINGKESYILNNRPDFKEECEIIRDENGKSTMHVTAEGVDASMEDFPPEGTYATKDYLTILCGFGDSIIDKYFTPTVIQKHACGVRYVLNSDIVINGKHIKSINALRIALLLQSLSSDGILPLDS